MARLVVASGAVSSKVTPLSCGSLPLTAPSCSHSALKSGHRRFAPGCVQVGRTVSPVAASPARRILSAWATAYHYRLLVRRLSRAYVKGVSGEQDGQLAGDPRVRRTRQAHHRGGACALPVSLAQSVLPSRLRDPSRALHLLKTARLGCDRQRPGYRYGDEKERQLPSDNQALVATRVSRRQANNSLRSSLHSADLD